VEAPVGIRWWLSDKVGIDAGVGFSSVPAPSYSNESLAGWAIDMGVPIVWQRWDRGSLLLRPGFLFESQQFEASSPPSAFSTNDATSFTVTAEIEAEIFLVENISVSASQGIAINSLNPPGPGDNRTSFGTIGRNFTTVGFHVYLWGN